ncbi:hypothetical protein BC829DRAFT_376598 [Chytridium lagenaria]|nr:hypothetical protein BC829DRAFT_376598 [Chytridium lagenaria]
MSKPRESREASAGTAKRQPKAKGKITVMKVNLASLASIRDFCKRYNETGLPIHVLLNNAGVYGFQRLTLSEDGIEMNFAVNFLAMFYLTMLLLPVLERTAETSDVRVVNVSSKIHALMFTPVYLEYINDPSRYNPFWTYGKSKVAVIQFTKELQRRLEQKGVNNIYVNTADPGFAATSVFYKEFSLLNIAAGIASRFLAFAPADAALTQIYAATSKDVVEKGWKGEYFVPIGRLGIATSIAGDEGYAREVWEWAERIIRQKGFEMKL